MNEQFDKREDQDRDEKTMARLLRLAGPRTPIPPDIEMRVFERVEREWKASSTQPDGSRVYRLVHSAWNNPSRINNRVKWAMPFALVASALLVIAVIIQPKPELPSIVPIGTVVKVIGDSQSSNLLPVGRKVFPGERVTTGSGEGVSLLLANAESLRVDENSALLIDQTNRFSLLHGRVYADTGDFMYRDRKLVIETPLGEVTDIGTQFSVAAVNGVLDVAVREGRVDVSQENQVLTAVAGERVRLSTDEEAFFERLQPHDLYWSWTSSLAPSYDIENKSLLDFLRWAARETGRELVFEDQELRMAAMRTDLHGSVSDFEPLEAVESILATTLFKYRIEHDRIIIER